MTWRCVIERWVQRKTDQKLIFNGNYTQIVFFVFFVSGYTFTMFYLIYLVIWSKNMCKHTLTHIIAKKCNFCLKKIAKNSPLFTANSRPIIPPNCTLLFGLRAAILCE